MQLRQISGKLCMALCAALLLIAAGCSTGLGSQPPADTTPPPADTTPPPADDDFEPEPDFDDDVLTDAEIHDNVHAALERAPGVDASDIHVSVDHGDVRLWGTVRSEQERQTAHDVAHSVRGVDSVSFSDLKVRR